MWRGVENEQRSRVNVEMSERTGCGEYLMRIFICVWQKKYFYVFWFCIDIM